MKIRTKCTFNANSLVSFVFVFFQWFGILQACEMRFHCANGLVVYATAQSRTLEQGSQTRGPHVAREGVLCGPRCFLEFSNNQH